MKNVILNSIHKAFATEHGVQHVLNGISADLEQGAITVILGRSGCGKTTLLKLLAGLDSPDTGEICMEETWKRVMLFQEPRLMPWLTAEENVLMGIHEKISATRKQEQARKLLAQVQLSGFEKFYPNQLSAGMQQRVALARALATQADLILMDEPFAALDYFTRDSMQQLLLELQSIYQRTIAFVTHQVDEAAVLGKRVLLLQSGRICMDMDLSHMDYPRNRLTSDMIQIQKQILSGFEENDLIEV